MTSITPEDLDNRQNRPASGWLAMTVAALTVAVAFAAAILL